MDSKGKNLLKASGILISGVVSLIAYKKYSKPTNTNKESNQKKLKLEWACPACGSKFGLDSINPTKIKKCPNCDAEVCLCTERLRAYTKSLPTDGHNCINCTHYVNKQGNPYFRYGAGTCELDHKPVKIMKRPTSRCHTKQFEIKSFK